MTKFLLLILLSLFFSASASSKEQRKFIATVKKENVISVTVASIKNIYHLPHDIVGFSVNCNRTRLIAWGVPNAISNENPQAEEVSVIDLKKGKRPRSIFLGRGIFGVSYLKDGISAYIESGYGAAVISKYGKLEYLESNADQEPKLEECPLFSGKTYSKWDNKRTHPLRQKQN